MAPKKLPSPKNSAPSSEDLPVSDVQTCLSSVRRLSVHVPLVCTYASDPENITCFSFEMKLCFLHEPIGI